MLFFRKRIDAQTDDFHATTTAAPVAVLLGGALLAGRGVRAAADPGSRPDPAGRAGLRAAGRRRGPGRRHHPGRRAPGALVPRARDARVHARDAVRHQLERPGRFERDGRAAGALVLAPRLSRVADPDLARGAG